jgi:hypothetical protein
LFRLHSNFRKPAVAWTAGETCLAFDTEAELFDEAVVVEIFRETETGTGQKEAMIQYKRTSRVEAMNLYLLEKTERREELLALYDVANTDPGVKDEKESEAVGGDCANMRETVRNTSDGATRCADGGQKSNATRMDKKNSSIVTSAGSTPAPSRGGDNNNNNNNNNATGAIPKRREESQKPEAASTGEANDDKNTLGVPAAGNAYGNNSDDAAEVTDAAAVLPPEAYPMQLEEDRAVMSVALYQEMLADLEAFKESNAMLFAEMELTKAHVAELTQILEETEGEKKCIIARYHKLEADLARCMEELAARQNVSDPAVIAKGAVAAANLEEKTKSATASEHEKPHEESEAQREERQKKVM